MSEFSTTPADPEKLAAYAAAQARLEAIPQHERTKEDYLTVMDAAEELWEGYPEEQQKTMVYPGSPPVEETTMPIINKAEYVLGWIVKTPLGGYNAIPKKGAWPPIDKEKFGGYPNYFGDLGVDTPYEAHNKCWPELDELLGANRMTKVEALLDLLDGHMSDLDSRDHPGNMHSGHFLGWLLDGPVGLPGIYKANHDGVPTTLDGTRELDDPYHQAHTIND